MENTTISKLTDGTEPEKFNELILEVEDERVETNVTNKTSGLITHCQHMYKRTIGLFINKITTLRVKKSLKMYFGIFIMTTLMMTFFYQNYTFESRLLMDKITDDDDVEKEDTEKIELCEAEEDKGSGEEHAEDTNSENKFTKDEMKLRQCFTYELTYHSSFFCRTIDSKTATICSWESDEGTPYVLFECNGKTLKKSKNRWKFYTQHFNDIMNRLNDNTGSISDEEKKSLKDDINGQRYFGKTEANKIRILTQSHKLKEDPFCKCEIKRSFILGSYSLPKYNSKYQCKTPNNLKEKKQNADKYSKDNNSI